MRLMSGFFASCPGFDFHSHSRAFKVKRVSHWSWFFLRSEQALLFFQDPIHLATKWRNRLLSPKTQLHFGSQSILIDHLQNIIEDDNYSKLDHGLTRSDVNPKDRQNFTSCVKLTSEDVFRILDTNRDNRGTLLYLQMLKMVITAYIDEKTSISERK